MSESDTAIEAARPDDWPLRPWLLAGMLGLAGLAVHLASDGGDDTPWRMALTAFFFFGPVAAALTIDRNDRVAPAIFGLGVGAVMAGIAWRVTSVQDRYSDTEYWIAAGILAVLLSVPLFQSGFHKLRWKTPYKVTHYHVWSDAICGAGALAFTGLSWALIAILAELFDVIQISLLKDLIDEEWFGWMFSGAAFGASLGVLRNQMKIIGTLQSVVLLVLSILAVPLAIALILFLLAVALSGIDVLWAATKSATPLLLACAVGAFVLTNAVVRDDDADASNSRVLRIAGFVLAIGILPLAAMAALSMGTRIDQHGLSPERLWALIAIGVAVAYGVGYFVAAIRGRKEGWRDLLRQANLHLAVITCVIAFLLAMPILNFGAISTSNQLGRLESGKVSAADFDYTALRWDFGEPGRGALAKMAKSSDAAIKEGAEIALAQESRPYRYGPVKEQTSDRDRRLANLRMEFDDTDLRRRVELAIAGRRWNCDKPCVALDIGEKAGVHTVAIVEGGGVYNLRIDMNQPLTDAKAQNMDPVSAVEIAAEVPEKDVEVKAGSDVEIREWTGRRVYVDGRPIGEPFE